MHYGAARMQGTFERFRLPPGRHGLSESHVRENQRWRLLGACAEIVAERGYGALSVRALSREASVSKATFYRQFDDLEDCVSATYEIAVEYALASTEGCASEAADGEMLRLRIESIFDLLSREPALAQVLTDEALLDVPDVRSIRAEFASRLAACLTAGIEPGGGMGQELGARLALHRIRAAFGYLALRLRDGSGANFSDSALELVQLLTR